MFEVVYTAAADDDVRAAFRYVRRRASARIARRWYDRLNACIGELSEMPERYPVVRDTSQVGFETREMLSGNRRHAYRIRYRILPNLVVILSVEHASRNR